MPGITRIRRFPLFLVLLIFLAVTESQGSLNKVHPSEVIKKIDAFYEKGKFLREVIILFDNFDKPTKSVTFRERECGDADDVPLCKLHSTNVSTPRRNSEAEVYPPYIPSTVCAGSCLKPFHKCMPDSYERRKIETMEIETNTQMTGEVPSRCYEVEFLYPVSCSCRCPVQERDCNVNQIYDSATCSCKCVNVCPEGQHRYKNCTCGNHSPWVQDENKLSAANVAIPVSLILPVILVIVITFIVINKWKSHRRRRQSERDCHEISDFSMELVPTT